MRVLYVSGKRSRELVLLDHLHDNASLEFEHVRFHFGSMKLLVFQSLITYFNKIIRFRPDIILFEYASVFSLLGVITYRLAGIPYVLRVKGNVWREFAEKATGDTIFVKCKKWINLRSTAISFDHATAVLPISRNISDILVSRFNIKIPAFIVHIPLIAQKKIPHNESNDPFILTVTNFNFWGKVEPLALAIKNAAPILEKRGLKWLILGDGIYFKRFKKEAEEELRAGNVQLLGWRDPYSYYAKAGALLYISGLDGLPNVILEAFSQELPVLMNNDCPASEFISDRINGMLVDIGNPEDIEQALAVVLEDKQLRQRIIENAYSNALSDFSVHAISEQLRETLVKIVNSGGSV